MVSIRFCAALCAWGLLSIQAADLSAKKIPERAWRQWQFSAWLGANFAGTSEYMERQIEKNLLSPILGLGVWYKQPWLLPEKLQIGLMSGFIRIFKGTNSEGVDTTISMIPIIAEAKYSITHRLIPNGFFAGAGAGYARGILTLQQQSFGTDAVALSARIGYELHWRDGVSVFAAVQALWLMQTLVIAQYGEASNTQMNLGLHIGVLYREQI